MIFDYNSPTPLYIQIYTHYKQQILDKKIAPYTKLPSIRQFTKKYNISKTTIEKGYQQLQIEGYIKSQPKSGYFVLPVSNIPRVKHHPIPLKTTAPQFKNLSQQETSFDMTPLKKAFQHVLYYQSKTLYTTPDPIGEISLRNAIQTYLQTERGVIADASQIIIASGIQNHFMTLASLSKKRRVAYLVPLFDRADYAFNILGFEKIPCVTIDAILNAKPDYIYISPSNLYPSGEVLSINDRLTLIHYAKRHNAMIIEDDYNHIFRYNAYQIPSIQGLAKGDNVIYIGSFARNLILSLRTSYMVLPPTLLKTYQSTPKLAQSVSKIDQLALAQFINDGHFQKHLKKLSSFSKKQNEFLTQLLTQLPINDHLSLSGLNSNLHIIIKSDDPAHFKTLLKKINAKNLYFKTFKELSNTLLLPYSGLNNQALTTLLTDLLT